MAKKEEYYNVMVGYEIKDLPEVNQLVNKLFEIQKVSGKKPIFVSHKDGSTFKSKDGTEKTYNIAVFLNKSEKGNAFATIKIEQEEDNTSDSPFD